MGRGGGGRRGASLAARRPSRVTALRLLNRRRARGRGTSVGVVLESDGVWIVPGRRRRVVTDGWPHPVSLDSVSVVSWVYL